MDKQTKRKIGKKVKFYSKLVFLPFLFQIDHTGKDRTGYIMTGIFAVIAVIFLVCCITGSGAKVFCLFGYIAVNTMSWILYIMDRDDRL